MTTFGFSYGGFGPLMGIMGLGRRVSRIEVDNGFLRVRMGWGFRAEVPLSALRDVSPYTGMVTGIGVHGVFGRWLVNGSTKGVVTMDVEPAQRAWLMFLIPLRLKQLRLSLEEPERFIAALAVDVT